MDINYRWVGGIRNGEVSLLMWHACGGTVPCGQGGAAAGMQQMQGGGIVMRILEWIWATWFQVVALAFMLWIEPVRSLVLVGGSVLVLWVAVSLTLRNGLPHKIVKTFPELGTK